MKDFYDYNPNENAKIKVLDYPSFEPIKRTKEETDKIIESSKRINCIIRKFIEDNNVHIILNNHIYLKLRNKDGFPLDKSLRVKVDGDLYNKILDLHNGELPRYLIYDSSLKDD